GKAVLTIAPSGETMLEDLGWTSFGNRPATTNQVVDALKAMGIKRIDHLVISHFDVDHIGEVSELLASIPVGHCYDHDDIQLAQQDNPRFAQMAEASKKHFEAYVVACEKIGRTILKPGDKLPIKGLDVQVLHAGGKWITGVAGSRRHQRSLFYSEAARSGAERFGGQCLHWPALHL